jgi:hypothetical protein
LEMLLKSIKTKSDNQLHYSSLDAAFFIQKHIYSSIDVFIMQRA